MDPNATLLELRKLVDDAETCMDSEAPVVMDELVEHIKALDEWLSMGGFPPQAWRHAR